MAHHVAFAEADHLDARHLPQHLCRLVQVARDRLEVLAQQKDHRRTTREVAWDNDGVERTDPVKFIEKDVLWNNEGLRWDHHGGKHEKKD